jgi:outer membrane protein OmpA-like peptidoglycan-associated protein
VAPVQPRPEPISKPVAEEPKMEKSMVNFKVLDAETREEIDYLITLISNKGSRKYILTQQQLNEELQIPQWENMLVSSKGYLPQELPQSQWTGLVNENILLKPATVGTSIVLENIQFNRGTSDFADSRSIQLLDNLVSFLKENPDLVVRLEGHTDNAGDPSLNKDLSMKRASKIRGYMTINGINFERVRISGWGGSRPVADNNTEEGRTMNRRVEMMIVN